jgi:hypothetical protein
VLKKAALLLVCGVLLIYAASTLLGRSREPRAQETAATVEGFEITPANAGVTSTLEVRQSGVSGAAGSVTSCRWFKNGSEIEGETENTLEPAHFRKGDQIQAEAAIAGQAPVRAPVVTIQNTPPRVVAAAAELRTEPSAVIYVEVSAVDADGDALSQKFAWYRNESEIGGKTDATLDVSGFRAGDKIYAVVTVGDGEDWSAPAKSDPIRIGSNAPAITSTPPQSLEEGRRFVYQIRTSAPEGAKLAYDLIGAPEGMTVSRGGLIQWALPNDAEGGTYSVVVQVSDPSGGKATQRVTIVAEKVEAPAPADTTAKQ